MQVFTGEKPFAYIDKDPVVVIELVRGGRPIRPILPTHSSRDRENTLFQTIDDSLWLLAESCWAFPPEQRPNMGEITEALRGHQQTTRLEESRSRTGGHLLTLPKPGEYDEIQAAPNLNSPLPLALQLEGAQPQRVLLDGLQIATTNLDPERAPSRSEAGTLYVAQRAHSVASRRGWWL